MVRDFPEKKGLMEVEVWISLAQPTEPASITAYALARNYSLAGFSRVPARNSVIQFYAHPFNQTRACRVALGNNLVSFLLSGSNSERARERAMG